MNNNKGFLRFKLAIFKKWITYLFMFALLHLFYTRDRIHSSQLKELCNLFVKSSWLESQKTLVIIQLCNNSLSFIDESFFLIAINIISYLCITCYSYVALLLFIHENEHGFQYTGMLPSHNRTFFLWATNVVSLNEQSYFCMWTEYSSLVNKVVLVIQHRLALLWSKLTLKDKRKTGYC